MITAPLPARGFGLSLLAYQAHCMSAYCVVPHRAVRGPGSIDNHIMGSSHQSYPAAISTSCTATMTSVQSVIGKHNANVPVSGMHRESAATYTIDQPYTVPEVPRSKPISQLRGWVGRPRHLLRHYVALSVLSGVLGVRGGSTPSHPTPREQVHIVGRSVEDGDGEETSQKSVTQMRYSARDEETSLVTTVHFLGENSGHFVKYLQQEIGLQGATEGEISKDKVEDLAKEKVYFAQLWRQGHLVVEDTNTLDVINNKTSFRELLMTYTHRIDRTDQDPLSHSDILSFLRREYGEDPTNQVTYQPSRSAPESMALLKQLLQWFKSQFPYYKSTCFHCHNLKQNHLIGVVAPSVVERRVNATLTEVYCCSECDRTFRFPRSVTMSRLLETRRGRCGEYSQFFFKTVEALGYRARWVVDWEDHVWVEVWLPGREWVHLDPCEAAVDEPLLYQQWGKNQTYILAFTREDVHDVTHVYTSDMDKARGRRKVGPQELQRLLGVATGILQSGQGRLRRLEGAQGGGEGKVPNRGREIEHTRAGPAARGGGERGETAEVRRSIGRQRRAAQREWHTGRTSLSPPSAPA